MPPRRISSSPIGSEGFLGRGNGLSKRRSRKGVSERRPRDSRRVKGASPGKRPGQQAIPYPFEESEIGRAAQHELPRATTSVDRSLDRDEKLGAAPRLVNRDRLRSGEQRIRLSSGGFEDGKVIEQVEPPAAEYGILSEKRGLPRLSQTGDDDDRHGIESLAGERGQFAPKIICHN